VNERLLRIWRDELADVLRELFEDVSEDDVAGAWERFAPERERLIGVLPPDPERGDGTSFTWAEQMVEATWRWALDELADPALNEPGSGLRSRFRVGADGKLHRVSWAGPPLAERFTRPPPATPEPGRDGRGP
jgi:hypothetical protein